MILQKISISFLQSQSIEAKMIPVETTKRFNFVLLWTELLSCTFRLKLFKLIYNCYLLFLSDIHWILSPFSFADDCALTLVSLPLIEARGLEESPRWHTFKRNIPKTDTIFKGAMISFSSRARESRVQQAAAVSCEEFSWPEETWIIKKFSRKLGRVSNFNKSINWRLGATQLGTPHERSCLDWSFDQVWCL